MTAIWQHHSTAGIRRFVYNGGLQPLPYPDPHHVQTPAAVTVADPFGLDRGRTLAYRSGAVRRRCPWPGPHRRTEATGRTQHPDPRHCRHQHGRGHRRPLCLRLQCRRTGEARTRTGLAGCA